MPGLAREEDAARRTPAEAAERGRVLEELDGLDQRLLRFIHAGDVGEAHAPRAARGDEGAGARGLAAAQEQRGADAGEEAEGKEHARGDEGGPGLARRECHRDARRGEALHELVPRFGVGHDRREPLARGLLHRDALAFDVHLRRRARSRRGDARASSV